VARAAAGPRLEGGGGELTVLELASTSRAQDAAYLAMADLAEVATPFGDEYRIVGGHMVTLLVASSGATGVPDRETADADFGVPFSVVRDPRLLDGLRARGYRPAGAANRFERAAVDLTLTIDVLAPSYTGRLEVNQPHGDLVVDEIPGLAYALARPGRRVTVRARLTDGSDITTTVLVPDVVAALCLKALAYRSRPTRTRWTCGGCSRPPTPKASPRLPGRPGRRPSPRPRCCTDTSVAQPAAVCAA